MKSVVFILSIALLPSVLCVQSRFDEYLWTKGSWPEFKLNRPRDRWRVEDAPLVYQRSRSLHLQGCSFVSTDGPGAVWPASTETERRPDWLTALVDSVLAGATVFGSVCGTAVEAGWKSITAEVYERNLPSSDRIEGTMEDACVEAVQNVFGRFSLKKEPSEGINVWRLVPKEEGEDDDDGVEAEAIEQACERFMHQRKDVFVRAINEAVAEFDDALKKAIDRQIENARGHNAKQRMMENRCEDIHPRCEFWADKGECVLNPDYMLNYCRVSCGMCQGQSTFVKVGSYYLGEDARLEIGTKAEQLSDGLKAELCPSSKPPPDVVDEIPYQQVLRGGEIDDVSRALTIELKSKCLLLHRQKWSYEVCFFDKIRQMRYDNDRETVIESYLLGDFGEQLQRHMKPLLLSHDEMHRYGVDGRRRPYILHIYENGDTCDGRVTRSAEVRLMCSEGLKQSMSSNAIGVTVEETEACHYVFNVFLSLMCRYTEYAYTEQQQ